MNDFFDTQTGGLNQLYGFLGQIADDSTWIGNHANKKFEHKLHLTNDIAGASRRVKVQILGKHVEVKNISDDQLPMAEVLLPTTAGSGHGGSHQTPNLKQGMYVFGFFKDGKQGTQPVIMGVLPNDPRVPLFGGNPNLTFEPRSGFNGAGRSIPVSTSYIRLEGPNSPVTAQGKSTSPLQVTVSHKDQHDDGKRPFFLPKNINCEGPSGELQGFQKQLKSFLFEVKRAKRASQQFIGAVSNLNSNISSLITTYTNLIAALAKSLIAKIRGFIVNRLNKELTRLFELLPPNLRPNTAQVSKKVNNTIQCVFNKIISGLLGIVKSLLEQVVDRYVNAPLCAAESFVSNLISSFLGDLTSGILGALGEISGVALDVAGLLFQAFDILIGVLQFLSCEPDLDCQILDEWSFWDGSTLVKTALGSNSGISSGLIAFAGSNDALGGGLIPGCSALPLFCGPPKLDFFGGVGSPASGNVVVGLTGQIMGVDLLTGGRYTQPGNIDVKIIDDCGLGNGAIGVAITEKYPNEDSRSSEQDEFFVSNVVILDPGSNYLTTPDGSTGGDGSLFSGKCDTVINTDVYVPGKTVKVKKGQTIYLPRRTVVEIVNNQGEVVQTLNGQGQLTPIAITENGTILTPDCAPLEESNGGSDSSGQLTPPPQPPLALTSPLITFPENFIRQSEGDLGATPFEIRVSRSGDLSRRSSANWRVVGSGNNPARPSDFVNGEYPSGIIVFRPNEETKVITVNVQGDLQVEKNEAFSISFTNLSNLRLDRKSRFRGVILNDDRSTSEQEEEEEDDRSDGGNSATYQVYVCIEDLAILNGGVNYSPGDQIVINPNNGAKFEPIIDEFGVLREVRLVAKGCGFTDNPEIFVESQTGINALLVPVYSFTRLDSEVDPFVVSPGAPVVNVVDCVGKVK